MPIDYKKYPANWKDEIRPRILKRANFKCEECGRKHKSHYTQSNWWQFGELDEFAIKYSIAAGIKIVRIILTIAHLDQNINNNADENLKALCQKCHLNLDRPFNILKRKISKANKAVTLGKAKK